MLFYVDMTGSRWLDLPLEVWAEILGYAVPVDPPERHPNLESYFEQIVYRPAAIIQANGSLRQYLLHIFYKHAAYCGERRQLLVPSAALPLMRKLVIGIPFKSRAFRTMARGLHMLPEEARRGLTWLGLCLGERAKLSESEFGSLAKAFPNLQKVVVDVAAEHAVHKELHSAVVGRSKAQVVSLTSRGLTGSSALRALVLRLSQHLESLDVGTVSWWALVRILQPTFRRQVRFPRLRVLRFGVALPGAETVSVPPVCQMPRLEHLYMDPECMQAWQPDAFLHHTVVSLYDLLLARPPEHLRSVTLCYIYDQQRILRLQSIEELHLMRLPGGDESEAVNTILALPRLRVLRDSIEGGHTPLAIGFAMNWSMRELDLRNMMFSLPELQQLLALLPNLASLRVLLHTRDGERLPIAPAEYHPEIKFLWANATDEKQTGWTSAHLNVLVGMVARMPALTTIWLFRKAIKRLQWAMNHHPEEDLVAMVQNAAINQCDWDDRLVHSPTRLLVA